MKKKVIISCYKKDYYRIPNCPYCNKKSGITRPFRAIRYNKAETWICWGCNEEFYIILRPYRKTNKVLLKII